MTLAPASLRRFVAPLLLAAAAVAGCDDDEEAASAAASASASAASTRAASAQAPTPAPSASSTERDEKPERAADAGESRGGWVPGELFDVGPAGPSHATEQGVVLIDRKGNLRLARIAKNAKPAEGKLGLDSVDAEPESFVALARGPAVVRGYAYWVANKQLLRRKLDGGKLETLATDARVGTRVAAAPLDESMPTVIAYVAHGNDRALVAKLWVEGRKPVTLTPTGASVYSVALARSNDALIAVSLEGRTAMSPVHARRITFQDQVPELRDDVVVWVAGSAQPLTELATTTADDGKVWALMAIERDISRFGLARIHISPIPKMNAPVSWRVYPNGLDPAPVAAARVCGQPAVVYARPSGAAPGAPQELHLASISADGLGDGVVLTRSRAFADVSLSAVDGGALVSYVADRRTWGMGVGCKAQ